MPDDNRPSPLAGAWYPAHPESLRALLADSIGPADNSALDEPAICGIVAPHAGLKYAGKVAGQAYRHLYGQQYDGVVVIGPSHYPYDGGLLTSAHRAFQTPLGAIPVAQDWIAALGQQVALTPVRNDPEHAIEIELPFLQHTLGAFRLLPLAMLDQHPAAAHALALALRQVLDGLNILYVASSDLSHFYSQSQAHMLDDQVLTALRANDPHAVLAAYADGRGIACGRGAIACVLWACQPCRPEVVGYATSGDVTGDFSRVVGYGSAVLYAVR